MRRGAQPDAGAPGRAATLQVQRGQKWEKSCALFRAGAVCGAGRAQLTVPVAGTVARSSRRGK